MTTKTEKRCKTCNAQAMYVCSNCSNYFCGQDCHVGDELQFIRTGYFAGTIADWSLFQNGTLVKRIDLLGTDKTWTTKKIPAKIVERIFYAVCEETAFTPDTKNEPCCDQGIDLYVIGKLSARAKDVPVLHALFQRIISDASEPIGVAVAFHPINVAVGDIFEFKYSTAAHIIRTLDLSTGLVLLDDRILQRNSKPGSSILHAMIIKALRHGQETITETTRLPGQPNNTATTRITTVLVS